MDAKEHLEHLATLDFESKETWEQDWTTDNPEFHSDEVNAMLIKQHDEFTSGRNNLRILVPLCGKSLDMVWLADQGHTVVGVELIRKGIEAFLRDNKLTHREEPITLAPEVQGTIFKVNEKDISLFECSIFDFSSEVAGGQFDCIWDRGAMTAINVMKEERLTQYRDVMLACLKPDGRYFIEFFAPESPEGMPSTFKFISEKSLTKLFEERCTIRFVGEDKMPDMASTDEQAAGSAEMAGDGETSKHAEHPTFGMYYYFMDFK